MISELRLKPELEENRSTNLSLILYNGIKTLSLTLHIIYIHPLSLTQYLMYIKKNQKYLN